MTAPRGRPVVLECDGVRCVRETAVWPGGRPARWLETDDGRLLCPRCATKYRAARADLADERRELRRRART